MRLQSTFALAVMTILATPAWPAEPLSAEQAQALVRTASENALVMLNDTSHLFRYTLKRETNSGTSVREMLETPNGIVARTLTWNGRELTPAERDLEDKKLARLASSREEQRKKFKEQQDDKDRVLRLVKALPDALLFEYDGTETIAGRETIRLRFKPNPRFSPPSKETYIFKASEGKLWIDTAVKRIVRLDGVLTSDVNVGWGLLGHLDKGGRTFLEQSLVGREQWRITTLNLDVTGTVLLFKSIKIHNHQTGTDYKETSSMAVAEAVDALRNGNGASNHGVAAPR
ncbi:MAG: hypothetical protein HYX26_09640 [Acidobacteriales bacterium]|nr:hypothetical protein [Terriglobales bacterium]